MAVSPMPLLIAKRGREKKKEKQRVKELSVVSSRIKLSSSPPPITNEADRDRTPWLLPVLPAHIPIDPVALVNQQYAWRARRL